MDAELTRRYANVRAAMAEQSSTRSSSPGASTRGFEGSVTDLSGLQIVHRYAYVVVPAAASRRSSSRPRRATSASTAPRSSSRSSSIGPASTSPRWRATTAGAALGVYGLDYVMARSRLPGARRRLELVPFDVEFDLARAVKSEPELESVRESVRINEDGFEAFHAAYAPGARRPR